MMISRQRFTTPGNEQDWQKKRSKTELTHFGVAARLLTNARDKSTRDTPCAEYLYVSLAVLGPLVRHVRILHEYTVPC